MSVLFLGVKTKQENFRILPGQDTIRKLKNGNGITFLFPL